MRGFGKADWVNTKLYQSAGFVITKPATSWKLAVLWYICAVIIGGLLFSAVETGRSPWDGIWWADITALSIGYGDIYPQTDLGRIIGLVLSNLVLIFLIPVIVSQMTLKLIVDRNAFTHEEQEEMKARLHESSEEIKKLRNQLTGMHEELVTLSAQLSRFMDRPGSSQSSTGV